MKWTNKLGLPEALAQAIINDPYDKGDSDFSITQLLRPARANILMELHKDELTDDVANHIFTLQGQSIHTILDRAAKSMNDCIVEQRFTSTFGEHTVSAQIDLYNKTTKTIQDYKVTSVYSTKGTLKEEYIYQLNFQKHLLEESGYPVNALQIVAILRDWSKPERDREREKGFNEYPDFQIKVLNIPILPTAELISWVESRVQAHLVSELPLCTEKERWNNGNIYALTEKGKSRALKLCDSEENAKLALLTFPGRDIKIEVRKGISKRCAAYCLAAPFCKQYQDELKGKK